MQLGQPDRPGALLGFGDGPLDLVQSGPGSVGRDQHLGQEVGVDREILGRPGRPLDCERFPIIGDPFVALARSGDGPTEIQPALGQMIGEPALAAEVDHALRQGAGRLGLAPVAAERHRDVERVQLATGVTQPLAPLRASRQNRSARS